MARYFDGATSYVDLGNPADLSPGAGGTMNGFGLAIGFFVRRDARRLGLADDEKIVSKWKAGGLQFLVRVDPTSDKMMFHAHDGNATEMSLASNATVSDRTGQWVWWGFVWSSAGTMWIYRDGVLDATGGGSSFAMTSRGASLQIGRE